MSDDRLIWFDRANKQYFIQDAGSAGFRNVQCKARYLNVLFFITIRMESNRSFVDFRIQFSDVKIQVGN